MLVNVMYSINKFLFFVFIREDLGGFLNINNNKLRKENIFKNSRR